MDDTSRVLSQHVLGVKRVLCEARVRLPLDFVLATFPFANFALCPFAVINDMLSPVRLSSELPILRVVLGTPDMEERGFMLPSQSCFQECVTVCVSGVGWGKKEGTCQFLMGECNVV